MVRAMPLHSLFKDQNDVILNIEESQHLDAQILRHGLLVAEPYMEDPHFKRAVVVLCEHSREGGTLGFILNKPLNMRLNALMADFPDFDTEVFYGGPVATDTLHYLHCLGDLLPDSVQLAPGLYWGGHFDSLKTLVETEYITPRDIRFFLGYSGWGAGQLHEEMRESSWLLGHVHANYVFKSRPNDGLWAEVLQQEGNAKAVIGSIPNDLTWN